MSQMKRRERYEVRSNLSNKFSCFEKEEEVIDIQRTSLDSIFLLIITCLSLLSIILTLVFFSHQHEKQIEIEL